MGAAGSGAVLYLVTTASVHPHPIWLYFILFGIFVAGAVLFLGTMGTTETTAEPAYGRAAAEGPRWPPPSAIRTIEDYAATLHRTWIRAGAPDAVTLERRIGGMAKSYQIAALFQAPTPDSLWEPEDFRIALLVLEALGVPEDLIKGWKAAAIRATAHQFKRIRIQAKARVREKRKKSQPHWLRITWSISVIGTYECTIAGLAYSHLNDKPALGIGNGLAIFFTVSIPLLVSVVVLAIVKEDYPAKSEVGNTAWLLPRLAFPVWSIGGFLVGFLILRHLGPIGHFGHDIRNWISWRF